MNIDKIWEGILMGVVVTAVAGLVIFIAQPKHTIKYELRSYDKMPAIKVDIENGFDDLIVFSSEISWSKAVQLVDSLNNTLKPIK